MLAYIYHTWILWDSSLTLIRKTFGRPKTFNEMFLFNAAVMGFGNSGWMHLVLEQHLGAAKQLGCLPRVNIEKKCQKTLGKSWEILGQAYVFLENDMECLVSAAF